MNADLNPLERLPFRRSYSTSSDSLLGDFYIPALSNSESYDRSAGFFSTGIIALAPLAFSEFIANNGKIRLICSPNFTKTDLDAVQANYENGHRTRDQIINDLEEYSQSSEISRSLTTLLSSLVNSDILELRIAIPASNRGLFHDKVGIFGNKNSCVTFVGSANETMAAWSGFDNHEQIEVFASWNSEDAYLRTREHKRLFNELWAGVRRGWKIMDPLQSKEILNRTVKPIEVDLALEQVRELAPTPKSIFTGGSTSTTQPRSLMKHQLDVISDWESNERRGLVCFATGGGKTLVGIEAARRWSSEGKPVLILVPSSLLHKQWYGELIQELPDRQILRLGNGFSLEGKEEIFRYALSRRTQGNIILSTYSMACQEKFLNLIDRPEDVLLCADEVHNIGANQNSALIKTLEFGARIGLSATPSRHGSSEETELINAYFGRVLNPLFTLRDAIKAGRLVPYNYYFELVQLDSLEMEKWSKLDSDIKQLIAIEKGIPTSGEKADRLKRMLMARADVVKGASAKIDLCKRVLEERFKEGDRWLVYCQNQDQMNAVRKAIENMNLTILDYHQNMSGDPEETLKKFSRDGGVMLAIKCLDEGVDIPEINRALILASSTNPREYIQRRGRVLRSHPGKFSANIVDVLVTDENGSLLSEKEAVRALEFATEAQNSASKLKIKMLIENQKVSSYVYAIGSTEETEV